MAKMRAPEGSPPATSIAVTVSRKKVPSYLSFESSVVDCKVKCPKKMPDKQAMSAISGAIFISTDEKREISEAEDSEE